MSISYSSLSLKTQVFKSDWSKLMRACQRLAHTSQNDVEKTSKDVTNILSVLLNLSIAIEKSKA